MPLADPGEADDVDEHDDGLLRPVELGRERRWRRAGRPRPGRNSGRGWPAGARAAAAAGARRRAGGPRRRRPPAPPQHSAPRAASQTCASHERRLDQTGPDRQQRRAAASSETTGERRPASSAAASAITTTARPSSARVAPFRAAASGQSRMLSIAVARNSLPGRRAGERGGEAVAGTGGRSAQHHDPPAQRRGLDTVAQQVEQRVGRQRAVRARSG